MKGIQSIDTSLGAIQAAFDQDGALVYLGFKDHEFREGLLARLSRLDLDPNPPAGGVTGLRNQLEAYAQGQRRTFELRLRLHGSTFEQRVWAALQRIPYGETRSYGQLAKAFGDVRLSRAVGRANGANPISILVPCHRVIGSTGALTGYAGGLPMKTRLLRLEGALPAPLIEPA